MIVGGGYIGLEVAASLTKLGAEVTVVEALERVMSRVVAPPVSDFFAASMPRRGVAILTGTAVAALDGEGRGKRGGHAATAGACRPSSW